MLDDTLPYTAHAEATLFHSEILSSDNTYLEYSNQQIHGIMLSLEQANKYLNYILCSTGKKKPNQNQTTTKHPAAVTPAEGTHCKLYTDSQGSEIFDRRTQVGSIA